jgi:serine protease AprX
MSVSAGNEGPRCSTILAPPGYEPSVITVGALAHKSTRIASFSSRGPANYRGATIRKPDLVAPGSSVRAAFPSMFGSSNSSYRSLSGTSMASPHVGGAVLLISAACPCYAYNVGKLQDLLELTASHYTVGSNDASIATCGNEGRFDVPNNIFGYGGIDIMAAIEKCVPDCGASSNSF